LLPIFDRSKYASGEGVARGAYVMADAPGGSPQILLIASGSEVALAIDAHETLIAGGIRSRAVSMPSWELFEQQPQDYRESVLPREVSARIAIEQGSTLGWDRYVGAAGKVVGMHTFGASAPLKELQRKFGFEPERIVTLAKEMLECKR
jgi:transketolase